MQVTNDNTIFNTKPSIESTQINDLVKFANVFDQASRLKKEQIVVITKKFNVTSSSLSFQMHFGKKSNVFGLTQTTDGKWTTTAEPLTKATYESYKTSTFNPPEQPSEAVNLTPINPPIAVFDRARREYIVPQALAGATITDASGRDCPSRTMTEEEESQFQEALEEYFINSELHLEKKEAKEEKKEANQKRETHKDTFVILSTPSSFSNESGLKTSKRDNLKKNSMTANEKSLEKAKDKKTADLKKEVEKEELDKEVSKKEKKETGWKKIY